MSVLSSKVFADNVDDATAALSTAYSNISLDLPSAGQAVALRAESHTLSNVTFGDLQMTPATVQSVQHPWFVVCVPVSGRVRIATRSEEAWVTPGRGAIVTPGVPVQVDYLSQQSHIRTLLFARSTLQEELYSMLGRAPSKPLDFKFGFDYSDGDPFGRTLSLLASEIDSPDGLTSVATLEARLGRLLMASLLTNSRHNYSEELLAGKVGVPRPRSIQGAIDAIETDPAGIETVADIAAVACLSVRALDAGFRQHVGVPPMRYLRQVRLARTHSALLTSDAESTTATAIARDWGFLHYGRFAAEYRQTYGSTPSETLKSLARA
jgi:AraC-like DNA-binding protein